MTTSEDLLPIVALQLPDKEAAEKMLAMLIRGEQLAQNKLNAIDAVTAENRDAVIEELTKVKQIHDKLRATREQATKWLDEKKQQFMSFERDSDYKDKDSLYTQKRNLIVAYDQEVLADTRRKEAEAERQRKISVYLTEVKAGVQRQLVDMVAAKKREFIEKFAGWKSRLTLENLTSQEQALVANKPALKMEDYDRCFNTKFQMMNILSTEEEIELQNSGFEYKEIVAKRNEINTQLHDQYFASLKTDLPYSTYNEDYVQHLTVIINEFRGGMPVLRQQLEYAKDNAEKTQKRQEELQKEAQDQINVVNATKGEQLEQVAAAKDGDVMEAEFTKQAQTSELPTGPVKKIVRFEHGQFLRPFAEIVAAVTAHPDFPGIVKKGTDEYVPGVQFWLTFYQTKSQIEEKRDGVLSPLIKGLVITEEARTTIKAKK